VLDLGGSTSPTGSDGGRLLGVILFNVVVAVIGVGRDIGIGLVGLLYVCDEGLSGTTALPIAYRGLVRISRGLVRMDRGGY